MAVDASAMWELVSSLQGLSASENGGSTEQATCTRVDSDGTVWVRLLGADIETPVNGQRLADVSAGDSLTVTISDGLLSIVGNASAPSTSASHVDKVVAPVAAGVDVARTVAASAQESAETAATAAQQAIEDAATASAAASAAQGSANQAQASATSANAHAVAALNSLATVEDVVDTLTWITEHGTMTKTTDTAVDPTKVYFVRDNSGEYTVGSYHYSIVQEPVVSGLSDYYELSIDKSVQNYIATHLSLTSEGLWLTPTESSGYRVLVAIGGSGNTYSDAGTYIIDGSGATIAQFTGTGISFAQNKTFHIGDTSAYISFDGNGHITIGGTGVTIGGKAPAGLLSDSDVTGNYIVGKVNNSSTTTTINASKINLVGAVTISDLASATQDAVLNSNVDVPDQMVWYGACSTGASTTAKSVTCTGFELLTGARIAIKFSNASTAASPTLNVNSTGAKAVWYNNEAASSTNPVRWGANATINFVYDGTYWVLDEKPPSYAAPCSTTASTRAKVATVAGALVVNGTAVSLQCSTANTYASNSLTFNLSSTGALTVYRDNAATSTTNKLLWDANTVLTLVMQGGYWYLADNGTRTMSEDAAADAAEAAKTATDYITYIDSTNGIKIAESNPSTSTTFMQLTSTFLDFVRGGTSMIKAWVDSTVAKVRVGAETGFNTLIDDEGIKLREGTAMSAQFTEDLIELGGEDAEISLCGGKGLIKYDSSLALPFQVLGAENVVISTNSQTSRAYVGVLDDSVDIYSGDVSLMSDTITVWATSLGTSHEYDTADFVDSIPVTLYDNASAGASASATLSETAANFKRLTIFFKDTDNNYSSVDVWSPDGKRVALSLTWINGASTQEMYQRVRWVTISGTSISTYKASSDSKYRTGQVKLGATASVINSDYISIVHVIGYR